jgi:enamine deaminase RidA (YjgF/YER057c/UK114 family)
VEPRIVRLNPPQLHQPPGYHHVTVVGAGPTVYLAGQCPIDARGQLVGSGNIDAQVDQVVENATSALAAAGVAPGDVVRSVIYVVSDATEGLERVWVRFLGSALAPAFTSAATLLGVARLGFSGQLVEVDLTAAPTAVPYGSSSQDATAQPAQCSGDGRPLPHPHPQQIDLELGEGGSPAR